MPRSEPYSKVTTSSNLVLLFARFALPQPARTMSGTLVYSHPSENG